MSDNSTWIITSDQHVPDPVPPWPLTPAEGQELLAATAASITAGIPDNQETEDP